MGEGVRSAAPTADLCSAPIGNKTQRLQPPGMTPISPGPADGIPRFAGLNVVRPRASALRALHVDPAAVPALTGTYPGETPGREALPREPSGAKRLGRVKDQLKPIPSRIK